LVVEIRRIHLRSKATYGAPRVTAELRRRGWTANHKRVERLMRQNGIVGYRPRRRRGLTEQDITTASAPTCWAGCLILTNRAWPGVAITGQPASSHAVEECPSRAGWRCPPQRRFYDSSIPWTSSHHACMSRKRDTTNIKASRAFSLEKCSGVA
jgi:transposase InsO family protein